MHAGVGRGRISAKVVCAPGLSVGVDSGSLNVNGPIVEVGADTAHVDVRPACVSVEHSSPELDVWSGGVLTGIAKANFRTSGSSSGH